MAMAAAQSAFPGERGSVAGRAGRHHRRRADAVGFLTAPTKQANASPNKIYVGVGSSNAEYWQDVLWGVGQMAQSVGAKVVVLDSGYEGAKHLQQLDAVLAPGCEHCVFVWFPDSPAFTKVTVDPVERAGAFVTTLWNRPEALHRGRSLLTRGWLTSRSMGWMLDTKTQWSFVRPLGATAA
jgi:ABC-type sugar transport system substrate-binding protein